MEERNLPVAPVDIRTEKVAVLGPRQEIDSSPGMTILSVVLHELSTGNVRNKGPFPLSDCESDVANNWVLMISMELFTFSDMIHQGKIWLSQ